MKNTMQLILFILLLFFIQNAFAEKAISVKEYNAKTIDLYKEIKNLKSKGLLYNNCGVGACAREEVKTWYKKWTKLNKTKYNGIPSLKTRNGDLVFVSDLLDIATGAYSDKGEIAFLKFELALICYEYPNLCP